MKEPGFEFEHAKFPCQTLSTYSPVNTLTKPQPHYLQAFQKASRHTLYRARRAARAHDTHVCPASSLRFPVHTPEPHKHANPFPHHLRTGNQSPKPAIQLDSLALGHADARAACLDTHSYFLSTRRNKIHAGSYNTSNPFSAEETQRAPLTHQTKTVPVVGVASYNVYKAQ